MPLSPAEKQLRYYLERGLTPWAAGAAVFLETEREAGRDLSAILEALEVLSVTEAAERFGLPVSEVGLYRAAQVMLEQSDTGSDTGRGSNRGE